MGYTCRGESGDFVLRRRTASNLTVEFSVSIGSWGKSVSAIYRVWGLGFKALLSLPPTAERSRTANIPTGDADHWQKIAENFGALVAELDRTFSRRSRLWRDLHRSGTAGERVFLWLHHAALQATRCHHRQAFRLTCCHHEDVLQLNFLVITRRP